MRKWLIGALIVGVGLLSGCDLTLDQAAAPAPAGTPASTATTPPAENPTPSPEVVAPSPGEIPPAAPVAPVPVPEDSTPAPEASLHRVVGVIDGDTIDVQIEGERRRIRVIGIDTPERDECGYQAATSAMQSLVQSRDVLLEADPSQGDADSYDRLLRHVFTADGTNVAEAIIAKGLGREYTYSSAYTYRDRHLSAEAVARDAGLGVWGDACGPDVATLVDDGACVIKGNINSKGVRIYHVPGQQHYDETIISPDKGERWFCSEDEARDAGWRASKR